MQIATHHINGAKIAEVLSADTLIKTLEDGLDLLGNLYYQDFDKIVMQEHHITPEFFDLKNGLAGEILQKFSNFRVQLAVVGDFTSYPGKSIRDFIYESNKKGQINFVSSTAEALRILSIK